MPTFHGRREASPLPSSAEWRAKIRDGANGPSSRFSGRVQQLRSCSDRCAPPRSHELKRLGHAVLTASFESQERLSSGGSCGVVVSRADTCLVASENVDDEGARLPPGGFSATLLTAALVHRSAIWRCHGPGGARCDADNESRALLLCWKQHIGRDRWHFSPVLCGPRRAWSVVASCLIGACAPAQVKVCTSSLIYGHKPQSLASSGSADQGRYK